MSDRVVIIGAGNMATTIAVALHNAGKTPVAVWSRTQQSAQLLAERVGASWSCDIAALPPADIVIISVVDSAFSEVSAAVASRYPNALLLHTAGSIPMDSLRTSGATRYGVFYPMQTVNKTNVAPLDNVTIFVEGCDDATTSRIETLAKALSGKVVYATSEQRCHLHVAAVFACNFPNAVYNMAAEILEKHGLPFDSMLPLIDEAARKVHKLHPSEAQTGPARRGDSNVMDAHKAILNNELANIYSTLSDYILRRNKNI